MNPDEPEDKSLKLSFKDRPGCVVPLIYFGMWYAWFSFYYGTGEFLSYSGSPLDHDAFYPAYILGPLIGGILFGRYVKRWLIHVLIAVLPISYTALWSLFNVPNGQETTLILQAVSSLFSGILGAYLSSSVRKEENKQ